MRSPFFGYYWAINFYWKCIYRFADVEIYRSCFGDVCALALLTHLFYIFVNEKIYKFHPAHKMGNNIELRFPLVTLVFSQKVLIGSSFFRCHYQFMRLFLLLRCLWFLTKGKEGKGRVNLDICDNFVIVINMQIWIAFVEILWKVL